MQFAPPQISKAQRPLWQSGYFWAVMLLQLIPVTRFLAVMLGDRYTYIDDATQHIFWMWQFTDPNRFRGDLMADYFIAQMPPGVYGLYWAASFLISPVVFNKILPVLLGIGSAVLLFLLAERLFNDRRVAFWATLVFVLQLWTTDDLSTGIARSFAYPLFLGFLYTLCRGWRWAVLGCLVLGCVFYQPVVVLALAVLTFVLIPGVAPEFQFNSRLWRRHLWLLIVGTLICAAILVPGQLIDGPFGPILTKAEALTDPALLDGGRNEMFVADPLRYWITSKRTGLGLTLMHPLCVLPALLVPVLRWRYGSRLSSLKGWSGWVTLLGRVFWASLATYVLAQLVLLHLYHPNRYVSFSVPIVGALFSGVAIAALLELCPRPWAGWSRTTLTAVLCLALLLAHLPLWPMGLRVGQYNQIYDFLRAQPATTRLASHPSEAGNLPLLTGLPVVASMEGALAWHPTYYRAMEQRLWETLNAFYTPSPQVLADYVERYKVDLFVVPLYRLSSPSRARLGLFVPFAGRARALVEANLAAGAKPVLQQLAEAQPLIQQEIQDGGLRDVMAIVPAQTIYQRAGR
ncbi:hypothetical protein [Leptolyngbya sp. FACHB-261]|uniref:hypothetical protein n=1 Tax=Leptolyngbya sp. FACHB-261 TaxID=2692806 RepID=UPI001686C9CC|nr:hypothetical protein [Leptolyngbya sp. FACHB-261]MBD2104798.1 hypothetical protein [Leptolyngbya sp. FACHB-261]